MGKMERLLPNYVNYPASVLKEKLLFKCNKQLARRVPLTLMPLETKTIFRSCFMREVMVYLAEECFEKTKQKYTFEEVFFPLLLHDWALVMVEAAAYAWLSNDPSELAANYPDQSFPEELNYGLVYSYYEPVMRMVCYLTGVTFREERENLPEAFVREAHESSIEQTLKKMDKADKEVVLREIAELSV